MTPKRFLYGNPTGRSPLSRFSGFSRVARRPRFRYSRSTRLHPLSPIPPILPISTANPITFPIRLLPWAHTHLAICCRKADQTVKLANEIQRKRQQRISAFPPFGILCLCIWKIRRTIQIEANRKIAMLVIQKDQQALHFPAASAFDLHGDKAIPALHQVIDLRR